MAVTYQRLRGAAAVSQGETNPAPAPNGDSSREAEIAQILESLRGLKYGSVSIIVQDGVIVQIDRLEKRRIRRTPGDGAPG